VTAAYVNQQLSDTTNKDQTFLWVDPFSVFRSAPPIWTLFAGTTRARAKASGTACGHKTPPEPERNTLRSWQPAGFSRCDDLEIG
jgi:hypothetical protein